jgi:hypothetical protein
MEKRELWYYCLGYKGQTEIIIETCRVTLQTSFYDSVVIGILWRHGQFYQVILPIVIDLLISMWIKLNNYILSGWVKTRVDERLSREEDLFDLFFKKNTPLVKDGTSTKLFK